MKEKDLEKYLNNLIIKGLIQEAEQDNAEFEAAMRNMSDEDFLSLIYDHANETAPAFSKSVEMAEKDTYDYLIDSNSDLSLKRRRLNWKPWLFAIASAAAILMIVLIPGYYSMNARVCQSALIASSAIGNPSRGVEISSMSKDEIMEKLPELKMQYQNSLERAEEIRQPEPTDNENSDYYIDQKDPREAGMDLVQAYLILNEKGKAIEVLSELSDRYENSDFGEHCKKLLEILK